jgi:branched-chain amino acid transport system substrate-binding protein
MAGRKWRAFLGLGLSLAMGAMLMKAASAAEEGPPVVIGVLNDMSGPYADLSGRGSVVAAELAIEDFTASHPRHPPIRLLAADHQNKADVGAAIVRRWIDREGVQAVIDVPNSAVALAVNEVIREKDRVFLASSTATSDLTGPQCAPTTVQWTFDTWALANGTARALTERGARRWFFITADYAFGHALARDAGELVRKAGGEVVGEARHPLNTTDFSSYLIPAIAAHPDVIALADAGTDATNAIKQAAEFGLRGANGPRLAGLLIFLTDVDALGLATAQGLVLTEAFYWDLDERTRAFAARFAARYQGRMPTMNHAGVYSSLLAYLETLDAMGWSDGEKPLPGHAVVAEMKKRRFDDPLFGPVQIRADGRAIHAMYLFEVKSPAESHSRWDYYRLLATIPAEVAFRPLAEGHCPLVH